MRPMFRVCYAGKKRFPKIVELTKDESKQIDEERLFVRGVSKELITVARGDSNVVIDMAIVMCVCNEGDNLPHGIAMAQVISQMMEIGTGKVIKVKRLICGSGYEKDANFICKVVWTSF